MEFNSKIYLIT